MNEERQIRTFLRRHFSRVLCAVCLLAVQGAVADDILTQRHDNARTSASINPRINTSTVAAWGDVLGTLLVGARVLAQPLYVENVPWSDGNSHNVVIIATAENKIFAFDAEAPFRAL